MKGKIIEKLVCLVCAFSMTFSPVVFAVEESLKAQDSVSVVSNDSHEKESIVKAESEEKQKDVKEKVEEKTEAKVEEKTESKTEENAEKVEAKSEEKAEAKAEEKVEKEEIKSEEKKEDKVEKSTEQEVEAEAKANLKENAEEKEVVTTIENNEQVEEKEEVTAIEDNEQVEEKEENEGVDDTIQEPLEKALTEVDSSEEQGELGENNLIEDEKNPEIEDDNSKDSSEEITTEDNENEAENDNDTTTDKNEGKLSKEEYDFINSLINNLENEGKNTSSNGNYQEQINEAGSSGDIYGENSGDVPVEPSGDELEEDVSGDELEEKNSGDVLEEEISGDKLEEEISGDELEGISGDGVKEVISGDAIEIVPEIGSPSGEDNSGDELDRVSFAYINPQKRVLVYNGDYQDWNGSVSNMDEKVTLTGDLRAKDAGVYEVILSLIDEDLYTWEDGTTAPKTSTWEIEKAKCWSYEDSQRQVFTYNGKKQKWYNEAIYEDENIDIEGKVAATEAGVYTIRLNLVDSDNYTWEDGTTGTKEIEWEIEPAKVWAYVPSQRKVFVYDGEEKTWPNHQYDEKLVRVNGTFSATEVGVYEISLELIDDTNYTWEDGTTGIKKIEWEIEPAEVWAYISSQRRVFVYDGEEKTWPGLTQYDEELVRVIGTLSATEVGVYEVGLELIDDTNYTWEDGTTKPKMVEWEIKAKEVGDLDNDGKISIIDVRLLLQTYINAPSDYEWTEDELKSMDLNEDKTVDIIDLRLLLQKYINS